MNLIRLHGNYLFSKINVIIISIVIFLAILLSFVLIKPFESINDRWVNRFLCIQNYSSSYLMFVKLLMVMLSSYLFGIYFSKSGDDYSSLIVCSISRKKYFFSKIITILLILFIIILSIMFFHLLIGVIFNRWYKVDIKILKQFGEIYLIAIVYGFISIVFIRLLKSLYAVMLSFCLYLVIEVLADYGVYNVIVRFTGLFLPTTYLKEGNIVLLYGMTHLLLVNGLYLLVSYFIYINYKE